MFDKVLAYQFIKKLTTPFTQWPGYKLGIIDANGNFLIDKSKFTTQQANAMGYFDILILNIKKLLAKIPGGSSRLGTVAATLLLLRSNPIKESYSENELEEALQEILEEVKHLYEDGAAAVNNAGGGDIAGIGQPPGSAKGAPGVPAANRNAYVRSNIKNEKKLKVASPVMSGLERRNSVSETEDFAKRNHEVFTDDYKDKSSKQIKPIIKFVKKVKDMTEEDTVISSTKKSNNGQPEIIMVQNPVVKKNKLTVDEASTLEYHKELNPKLWDEDNTLKETVRNKLIQIADSWLLFTRIPQNLVHDIVITGGNVNYNYTPNSDIDLHIVVSRDSINPDRDLVDEYLQDKKILWTLQHENISIYGYPVELYAQDINEIAHQDQGVYSLIQNRWLARPRLLDLNFENDYHLQKKSQFYKDMIDKMLASNASDASIDKLRNKIKKMRSDSIAKNGEFAFGNLVFKELRNAGYLDKLNNYKNNRIDTTLSLKDI
jgi:hypothetical protein